MRSKYQLHCQLQLPRRSGITRWITGPGYKQSYSFYAEMRTPLTGGLQLKFDTTERVVFVLATLLLLAIGALAQRFRIQEEDEPLSERPIRRKEPSLADLQFSLF
jgi:hypothetical protein